MSIDYIPNYIKNNKITIDKFCCEKKHYGIVLDEHFQNLREIYVNIINEIMSLIGSRICTERLNGISSDDPYTFLYVSKCIAELGIVNYMCNDNWSKTKSKQFRTLSKKFIDFTNLIKKYIKYPESNDNDENL